MLSSVSPSSLSPSTAILSTLTLFERCSFAAGEVRRSSLFGFELDGRRYDRDELAALVDAACPPAPAQGAREPRPGLVRLPAAVPAPASAPTPSRPPASLLDAPAPLEEEPADLEEEVLGLDVAVGDAAGADHLEPARPTLASGRGATPPPTAPVDDGRETIPTADPAALSPAVAALQVLGTDYGADDEDVELPEPKVAARHCVACNGGARRIRHGCNRCHGRGVRIWIDETELLRSPPRAPKERLGVVHALIELLPELSTEIAVQGAQGLFNLALAGADEETRAAGIREIRWAFEKLRSAS